MFLYYMRHDMNFHSCGKQIFKSFGYTRIHKDLKLTKTSRTTSNNVSQPVFSYHVHNQADFNNPFINRRDLFT